MKDLIYFQEKLEQVKSIMIDAIDFVLGGKFSKSLIRTGEDKTYVEAIFTLEGSKVFKVLDELDIEYDDVLNYFKRKSCKWKKLN